MVELVATKSTLGGELASRLAGAASISLARSGQRHGNRVGSGGAAALHQAGQSLWDRDLDSRDGSRASFGGIVAPDGPTQEGGRGVETTPDPFSFPGSSPKRPGC